MIVWIGRERGTLTVSGELDKKVAAPEAMRFKAA
jgi:hypothetical protein